jgi:hypothetical protein
MKKPRNLWRNGMPNKLTKEEFIEKYGQVKVKFDHYYKYSFNYTGELPDGGKILVAYGGNSDDIYKYSVSSDREETVGEIYPFMGTAYDNKGHIIDEFYEY